MSNYFIFVQSSLGVWTAKGRTIYAVDECIKATEVEGASDDVKEKDESTATKWAKHTSAWSSIIAPRCILYMVMPWLTPAMLYTTLMVKCPLWIADTAVVCPGWFDLATYRERARHEINARMDQQWMVWLDSFYLYATEGRLVQSLVNLYKFALAVALWQLGKASANDSERVGSAVATVALSSLVVLVPYSVALSLKLIVLLGKSLGIKDADIWSRESPAAPQTAAADPSHAAQSTVSAELDFGLLHKVFGDGDVEIVDQVDSPLALQPVALTARLSHGTLQTTSATGCRLPAGL